MIDHVSIKHCSTDCRRGCLTNCAVDQTTPNQQILSQGVDLSSASSIEFPVVSVSSTMGWDSAIVKKVEIV